MFLISEVLLWIDTVLEGAEASFAPVASHISGGSRPDFYRVVLPPYRMVCFTICTRKLDGHCAFVPGD